MDLSAMDGPVNLVENLQGFFEDQQLWLPLIRSMYAIASRRFPVGVRMASAPIVSEMDFSSENVSWIGTFAMSCIQTLPCFLKVSIVSPQ